MQEGSGRTSGMFAMKLIRPIFSLGILSVAACFALETPAWADVKAGVDAWSAGNYEGAVREWRPAAEQGDADAMFNLAQAYKMGRGVSVDLDKAENLYGKAAAKGHVQAADTYGLLLFQRGDREKSIPYIKGAAAHGDPRAQYILGIAHFNGDLVSKDWVRAYALVSLANQAGLAQAANALVQMDQSISLADRQKSVPLSRKLAAEAEATRARQVAAAELGPPAATVNSDPARSPSSPEIVSAERAVAEAMKAAGTESAASAGADYARPTATPQPVASPSQVSAPAKATKNGDVQKPVDKPAVSKSGPWRVQLGAFGVAGNAEAQWNRLKGRPELAGHSKLLVPAGKLTKLQAGGFASKASADAACKRLSSAGIGCLPVTD